MHTIVTVDVCALRLDLHDECASLHGLFTWYKSDQSSGGCPVKETY